MRSVLRRKMVTVPAVLALMLGGTAAAAQTPLSAPMELANASDEVGTSVALDCDGGTQEASLVRTDNAPVTVGESLGFAPIPNTFRTFTTPAGDTDQVRVGFTAEASLFGAVFNNTALVDALASIFRDLV
jgi:hypothetical protein